MARLQRLTHPIGLITRFRLDAAWYEPVPPRPAGQRGRPRVKGVRRPTLAHVLHDGETVIYNGNFWTVNDWQLHGNGSLGNNLPYFVLNHGSSASDLNGTVADGTRYLSIPCTTVRSLR